MAIWRPPAQIRVKVIGLAWRGDALLLGEVMDDLGRLKGLRPLGGSVEFGETREQALLREFREELGCSVRIAGPWRVFENIYAHEGAVGHEIVFAADVALGSPDLYARDRIAFEEPGFGACAAIWRPPGRLPEGVALYPDGLLALIRAGEIGPP